MHALHLNKNVPALRKDVIICVKCNTQNPDAQTNCMNCGFKLRSDTVISFESGTPQVTIVSKDQPDQNFSGHKNAAQHHFYSNTGNEAAYKGACQSCGYLMSGSSNTCPDCGHKNADKGGLLMNENAENIKSSEGLHTIGQSSQMNEDMYSNESTALNPLENHVPTVRIFNNDQNKFTAFLEPLELNKEDSRDRTMIPVDPSGTIINRALVDLDDATISSGKHASITYADGKWHIENCASNKALFVQVKDATTLSDGDVVLFGIDKFFVFREDQIKTT